MVGKDERNYEEEEERRAAERNSWDNEELW